jgi:hypothetical protein
MATPKCLRAIGNLLKVSDRLEHTPQYSRLRPADTLPEVEPTSETLFYDGELQQNYYTECVTASQTFRHRGRTGFSTTAKC